MPSLFRLKDAVGASRDSDPEDVMSLKQALNQLGHFEPDPDIGFNGFVDRRLDAGIRRFQKSAGLLVTGEVKAGDDTEQAIFADLRKVGRHRGKQGLPAAGGQTKRAGKNGSSDFPLVGPGGVNTGEDDLTGPARRSSEQFGDIEDEFAKAPQRASERVGDIERDIGRRMLADEVLSSLDKTLERRDADMTGAPRDDDETIQFGKSIITVNAAKMIQEISKLRPRRTRESSKDYERAVVVPMRRKVRLAFRGKTRTMEFFQAVLSDVVEDNQGLDNENVERLLRAADVRNQAGRRLVRSVAGAIHPGFPKSSGK